MISLADFHSKEAKIAVVGLGYVGLPLAVEFAKLYSVIGLDVSTKKIEELKQNIDVTHEVSSEDLAANPLHYTTDAADLQQADVVIVTVPTPIDSQNQPDLYLVEKATETIAQNLKDGAIVVYESTVYPGVTEDVCVPILEKVTGKTANKDFFIGYSPERLSPGEKNRTLTKVVKVVAGSTEPIATLLCELYGSIITAGIHKASSIKVAEAAKVIENTQRDLNVALMNELSMIFNKMGINTLEVIEAAGTKWNFMKMTPGLVGGHCIGVDPYYLTYKAQQLGHDPYVILAGRKINDSMGKYVAEQTVKHLIQADIPVRGATVLMMGITFKENVADIRNSKVVDIIRELDEYGVNTVIYDPYADSKETEHEYGLSVTTDFSDLPQVDGIVAAVNHNTFLELKPSDILAKVSAKQKVFMDIKSTYKTVSEIRENTLYWTL